MRIPKFLQEHFRAKPKKVRSNAKLKKLGAELREEISLYAEDHSLEETVKWLKTKRIETSKAALSRFLIEYRIQCQFERSALLVQALLVSMKKQDPSLTPESIRQVGQRLFNTMAINNKDACVWNVLQQLELKRDQFELARQWFLESVKKRKAKGISPRRKGDWRAGIQTETLEQIERELKLM